MNFDLIQGVLTNGVRVVNADTEIGVYRQEQMIYACKLALDVWQKSPKFKLYSPNELFLRGEIAKLGDDEVNDITQHLPYTAFSIVEPLTSTFVIQGDPLNLNSGVGDWTFIHMLDQPSNRSAFCFPAYCVHVNDLGELDLFWASCFQDSDDEHQRKEVERMAGHVIRLLAILSVFRNNYYTVSSDEKLQIKRARKGKLPLYEYKIIPLESMAASVIPKHQRYKVLGRRSPRTHLRRGHWAGVGDQRVFRRSCIVNAKAQHTLGRITKDYDVQ